jgi:hypothetical protein
MVETIVPVVHGTRSWIVSIVAFALGALATAAAVGLVLGALLPTGGGRALLAAGCLALAYAAAELGLVRLPSPQLRRQVPQRWRERYPQPLTALLYGGGLGLGFVTYLPVATLLVVCGGVALVAGPLGGAAALSGFGLGRAVVLFVTTRGVKTYECATGRVESLAGWERGGRLRRANGLALVVLGALLLLAAFGGTAQAATKIDLGPNPVANPSLGDGDVIAYDQITGGTVHGKLLANGTTSALPGFHPDVDGTRVVVDTGATFEIIDVATGNVVDTRPLAGSDPALSGNWLVYRRVVSSGRQIVAVNLNTSAVKIIAQGSARVDLGAPDVSWPRVVYARTGDARSAIWIFRLDTGYTRMLRYASRAVYAHAAIDSNLVAFVRQVRADQQFVRVNLLDDSGAVLYTQPAGSGRHLWAGSVHSWRFAFTAYDAASSAIYKP